MMRSEYSIEMRFAALLVVSLFCYHVAVVLAEHRTDDTPNSNNYLMTEPSNLLRSGAVVAAARQRTARDQQVLEEQQQQVEGRFGFPQYSIHYNRDIDQEGNLRPTLNIEELAKLEDLLEAMSVRFAQPPPQEQIYRTGRTYYGPINSAGRQQQQQLQQATAAAAAANNNNGLLEAAAFNRYGAQPRRQTSPPSPLNLWSQPGRSIAGGPLSGRANARRSHMSPHHTSDTAEVVIQTPLHSSRSVSDYEWKRVENSRWNNLKGMWGKRSVPINGALDEEQNDNSGADSITKSQQQQQQQQRQKRSQIESDNTSVNSGNSFM